MAEPPHFDTGAARRLLGYDVLDSGGEPLGKVHDIQVDLETGIPVWMQVGREGMRDRYVPYATASLMGTEQVQISLTSDRFVRAPVVKLDKGHSLDAHGLLQRYYGFDNQVIPRPTGPIKDWP